MRNQRNAQPLELSQDSGKFRCKTQSPLAMTQESCLEGGLNACGRIGAPLQTRVKRRQEAMIRGQPEDPVPLQVLLQGCVEPGRIGMTGCAEQIEFSIRRSWR